jgi:hypothetical protein
MLSIKFNIPGCFIGILIFILLIFFFKFLFKFWFLIFLGIVLFMLYGNLSKIINSNTVAERKFVSKPGKVYKECDYCGTKAERNANSCRSCGKPFEQT